MLETDLFEKETEAEFDIFKNVSFEINQKTNFLDSKSFNYFQTFLEKKLTKMLLITVVHTYPEIKIEITKSSELTIFEQLPRWKQFC